MAHTLRWETPATYFEHSQRTRPASTRPECVGSSAAVHSAHPAFISLAKKPLSANCRAA